MLLSLAGIIPYVGFIFQSITPFVAFGVFFFIGVHTRSAATGLGPHGRTLLICYAGLVCTCTFVAPYVSGYYTYPVTVARAVSASRHVEVSYGQASKVGKALLRTETGGDGVLAYAVYSERRRLSAKSFGEYVGSQFEDIDSPEGFIGAVVNVVLWSVPMLLKWVLCDKLKWVVDGAYVGLMFWYAFSVTLSYWGYKSAD